MHGNRLLGPPINSVMKSNWTCQEIANVLLVIDRFCVSFKLSCPTYHAYHIWRWFENWQRLTTWGNKGFKCKSCRLHSQYSFPNEYFTCIYITTVLSWTRLDIVMQFIGFHLHSNPVMSCIYPSSSFYDALQDSIISESSCICNLKRCSEIIAQITTLFQSLPHFLWISVGLA